MNEHFYTYEIAAVDETARCMEIVYSSEGRQTMRVCARLPFDGESLETVVSMYAPVAYWLDQERAVVPPSIGEKGTAAIRIEPTPQQNPVQYESANQDKAAICEFLAEKGLNSEVEYMCSMFNVTNGELLANLFGNTNHLVKALNGNVVEWYEVGATVNGVKYAYVAKDLQTGTVLDRYILDQRGLVKFTQNSDEEPTVTHFGSLSTVPPLLRPSLSALPFKERITGWSVKSYGFVVEFVRQTGDVSQ